jgi:dipeptidyl aminopeptidase/acylaminoacyl peptidase
MAGIVCGLFLPPALFGAPRPKAESPDTFLVEESGVPSLLGPDGRETERLDPPTRNAILSPDRRWLAGVEFDRDRGRCVLVLRPHGHGDDPITIPMLWDEPGRSGSLPVWAPDGGKVLIGENRPGPGGRLEYAHRVYDLRDKTLRDLKLPAACQPTGWEPGGKRLLVTVAPGDGKCRLAWVPAAGGGESDYLTPADVTAYGGRLSSDGKRVLCLAGPKDSKGPDDGPRLTVLDLGTGKRTVLDEPGHTYGYCWSPGGTMVAYTWQRPLGDPPAAERETLLVTCTADGRDRKTVTARKYTPSAKSNGRTGVVYFFTVVAWWRAMPRSNYRGRGPGDE